MSEALYAWEMKAQQWRDDPYYVASSSPIERVIVVAPDRAAAFRELWRVLGPASSNRRWKGWVLGAKDTRLVTEPTGSDHTEGSFAEVLQTPTQDHTDRSTT